MPAFPSLPRDTAVTDPMLNTIVQMFKVARVPLTIIATVGHKAQFGQSLDCDFAKKASIGSYLISAREETILVLLQQEYLVINTDVLLECMVFVCTDIYQQDSSVVECLPKD